MDNVQNAPIEQSDAKIESLQTNTPPNPPKPKRKINFLKLFIFGFVIIITILAFSLIAYLIMGNQTKQKAITTYEECVAAGFPIMESYPEQCAANGQTFARALTAEEQKKLNSTADWKEYKDDEYKISFFYPPNLAIKKEVHDPIGAEIFVFDPKIGTESGALADMLIYDEYFANYLPEYITFDSFYASSSGSLFTINSEVFGNYKLTKESNFDLEGKKAFYYSRIPLPLDPNSPGTGKGAYIKINNESILVIESPETKINELKEILSTFKFMQ